MPTASIYINKLAAAKRQLQAAIRLFFMVEDELAVHTVVAAAYGLLKDIKRNRGMSEAADSYLYSIFYCVRDYRRGMLPAHVTGNAPFMAEIDRMAHELPEITADSEISDVVLTGLSRELERKYWQQTNLAANFLKHADRDSDELLALTEIDNHLLLIKCHCAYGDVPRDDLGHEGAVFAAFVAANNPSYVVGGTTSFDSLVTSVRRIPIDRQLEFCHMAITQLNAQD